MADGARRFFLEWNGRPARGATTAAALVAPCDFYAFRDKRMSIRSCVYASAASPGRPRMRRTSKTQRRHAIVFELNRRIVLPGTLLFIYFLWTDLEPEPQGERTCWDWVAHSLPALASPRRRCSRRWRRSTARWRR